MASRCLQRLSTRIKQRHPSRLFEVFTPEQAKEVEAIAARIIPTDELPGATEAGVVYFIDRALKTFASDNLPLYHNGSCRSEPRQPRRCFPA